jgi:hypothetical protein
VTYFDPICFDMSRRLDPTAAVKPGLLDRGERTAGLLPEPDLPFELLDQSTHRGLDVQGCTGARFALSSSQPPCAYRILDSAILMVKAAEDRSRCNGAKPLNDAIKRCVLGQ